MLCRFCFSHYLVILIRKQTPRFLLFEQLLLVSLALLTSLLEDLLL